MFDPHAAGRLIANRGDLKRKAVNFTRGHDVRLSPDLRGKIEKVIVKNQAEFEASAREMLHTLKEAWGSASFNSIGRARYYEWIRDLALELKGQGSLFGYPLVTLYADSLKNLCDGLTNPTYRLHAIIGLNIDALGIIIRRRVTGPGSVLERRVAEAFREAYLKMRLRQPSDVAMEHKVAHAVRELDKPRPAAAKAPELKDTGREWPNGVRLTAD
ncbi:hypothetical protein [Ferrovibrio terrae]|jgi:hypothetical protein|uniref:hypothetical protein n=1 Tax=Ferrovibrio terrae TaxID=2594003 RepID=UPI003137730A